MTRRTSLVLVAVAAAFAGLAVAWDWNWFRDPVVNHFAERSGRAVNVGDVHIAFDGFDPVVRLRQVEIANAPWARATAGKPFAKAGEVSFTFAWRSLIERRPVVARLVMVDADIALERRADGLRNWRLRNPDDRDPGIYKFLRLEARNSRLHFAHEGIGLDVRTTASDLSAPRGALTTRIDFEGQYHGADFSGRADTARTLTFLDTGEPFEVDGHGRSGPTRLDATGRVTDLFQLANVDVQLKLAGPSLADVRRLLPQAWPHTAAYEADAKLVKVEDSWTFTDLKVAVGKSDVGGELRYDRHGDRPYLEATLTSQTTRIDDVWPDQPGSKSSGEAPPLDDFDGEVSLLVRTLHVAHLPPVTQLRVKAKLDAGRLDFSPVQAQLAGGQAQGLMSYDTREKPAVARAELSWRNLRLEQLLPELPDKGEASGPVSGEARFHSQGSTVTALMKQASGRANVFLRGGRLSAGLDARLALDGGKILKAAVTDAADVPILCARAELVLRDGKGELFPLLLDTATTRVDGRGQLDLHTRRADALLTPSPKGTALLALRRSLKVKGDADGFGVDLVKAEPIVPEVACDATPAVKAR